LEEETLSYKPIPLDALLPPKTIEQQSLEALLRIEKFQHDILSELKKQTAKLTPPETKGRK